MNRIPTIGLVPGDDWDEVLEVEDEAGPIDYSGWSITFAKVEWPGGAATLAVNLAEAASGRFRITADKSLTAGLPRGDNGGRSELTIKGVSSGGLDQTIYYARVAGVRVRAQNILYVRHPGIQGATTWDGLQGKPATFPPLAHSHAFADLTAKPTTLAGYGITDAAPKADPAITGRIMQTGGNGELYRHDGDTSGGSPDGGYNFSFWRGSVAFSNGPPGDVSYVDDAYGWGINMAGLSIRADNAKQYAAWHIESKFYTNASQLQPWTEVHLNLVDTAGGYHRPFYYIAEHGGAWDSMVLGATTINLADHAAAQRVKFDFTGATTSITFGVAVSFLFETNNTPMFKQKNAGASSYLNLPFFDASDRLQLGGPINAGGATPTGGALANVHSNIQPSSISANGVALNVALPAVTGDVNGFNLQGPATGKLINTLAYNNNANGHALARMMSGTNGDCLLSFEVAFAGGTAWTVGVDNSDSDKFKINPEYQSLTTGGDCLVLDSSGLLKLKGPIKPKDYTVGTVPSASASGAGALIYVTNEAGGSCHASSDGTSWRRPSDRAVIS